MKIGIFKSFEADFYENAVKACESLNVEYEVVDILSSDWLSNVLASNCDGFYCPSTCSSQVKKNLLDERYYFVSKIIKKPIYPDYNGLYIHENKRNMAAWLEYYNFPHVVTKVFSDYHEAEEFLSNSEYPLVFKANLGSGASKVRIIRKKRQALKFARAVFPKRIHGKSLAFLHLGKFYAKRILGFPFPDLSSPQRDYLIVQEFKKIKCEWRIIKIGESYFGHQKLLRGDYASGSGKVGWEAPPIVLLELVKNICDTGGFLCMDVDIFETNDGNYYVNELQSSFGSYLDSQMIIEGKPGRFLYKNGKFVFEEGIFNTYGSCKLKIDHFCKILQNQNYERN